MAQHDKLVKRLQGKPKDFTWGELVTLLEGFSYVQEAGSGSRRKFFNPKSGAIINLHEPHPRKELKRYQIRDVIMHLEQEGLI